MLATDVIDTNNKSYGTKDGEWIQRYGFNNKYKDQIFTIFQRLHGRGEYEGTGIGLATCRKIVERHGGDIDTDGRLGEGTTFTVALPVVQF